MSGLVRSVRTHNVSVVSTSTAPNGSKVHSTTVMPGEQETHSFRSGVQGPSIEEQLLIDSQIYVRSDKYNSMYDTGHEFYSHDSYFKGTSLKKFSYDNPNYPGYSWSGPIVLLGQGGSIGLRPMVAPMTSSSMKVHGTRAINATIPTKPDAGLTQFLGELKRDGIPALYGAQLIRSRYKPADFASEYLNHEFGVKPLLSDLKKLAVTVKNSSQVIQQLQRDSGRVVRRRFSFPVIKSTETSEVVNTTFGSPLLANLPYTQMADDSSRVCRITDALTENIWFSGAYTYYCDMGSTLISRFRYYETLANKILGTRLDVGVLYDLTAWSWLLDWWTDLGTVLSSASAFQSDGLVIRYGYLMREKSIHRTVGSSFHIYDTNPTVPVTNTYLAVSKERYKATPYGFGLLHEDFTLRQWAILGALGMTLAPGKMR